MQKAHKLQNGRFNPGEINTSQNDSGLVCVRVCACVLVCVLNI